MRAGIRGAWPALVAVLALSCGGVGPSSPPPDAAHSPVAAAATPWFDDITADAGVTFQHRSGHDAGTYRLPEIMGGGAALFDMEGDGDLDLLLVQSGRLDGSDTGSRHRLFRNDGRARFEDVT